jgi:hypothetical protein
MKNKLLYVSLACTFLLSVAVANECPLKSDGPIMKAVTYLGHDRQLSCDYVSRVESLIEEVQKFSEDKVKVNLVVRSANDGASFDGGYNIDVPEQLVFYGEYGQDFGMDIFSNLTVVAHEYGHALLDKKFNQILSPKYPVVKDYFDARKELSNLEIEFAKNPTSEELKNRIEAKTKKVQNDGAFNRFFVLLLPYSELYADVVAVYNDNDKSAVYNALYYPQMTKFAHKMVKTRDFGAEFDINVYDRYMTEAHGYFANTRTYIGNNLWPKNDVEKNQILKKLSNAIIEEMSQILDKDGVLPDYDVGNASLIKRLSQKN